MKVVAALNPLYKEVYEKPSSLVDWWHRHADSPFMPVLHVNDGGRGPGNLDNWLGYYGNIAAVTGRRPWVMYDYEPSAELGYTLDPTHAASTLIAIREHLEKKGFEQIRIAVYGTETGLLQKKYAQTVLKYADFLLLDCYIHSKLTVKEWAVRTEVRLRTAIKLRGCERVAPIFWTDQYKDVSADKMLTPLTAAACTEALYEIHDRIEESESERLDRRVFMLFPTFWSGVRFPKNEQGVSTMERLPEDPQAPWIEVVKWRAKK